MITGANEFVFNSSEPNCRLNSLDWDVSPGDPVGDYSGSENPPLIRKPGPPSVPKPPRLRPPDTFFDHPTLCADNTFSPSTGRGTCGGGGGGHGGISPIIPFPIIKGNYP